jgi:hypothetical protein
MAKTFIGLCGYADWSDTPMTSAPADITTSSEQSKPIEPPVMPVQESRAAGFDLNYNIHIHLPATRDQAVYDALFASLAKHIPLK